MTKIAVTGATGRLGQPLVEILEAQGHEVVPIARSKGVDVISGEGLAEALDGVEVIVDAATGPSPDRQEATDFFTTSARNLQEAGEAAGVKRAVLVSIVGIDRFKTGYNAAKLAQERAWEDGPIATRILRATQFHEFVPQLLEWGRQGDVAYVPTMQTQVVAARTVAEALAELATLPDSAPASGPTLEIAGPRPERLVELARTLVAERGESLSVEETAEFFDESELYDSGAALPGPSAKLAGPTFEEWLKAS
jgi:uncharacterized protein YbjT (DUF2867 family)